jgi:tetratricopeptide (TPR) repeat protein
MKNTFKLSSLMLSLILCFNIAKSHAQSSNKYYKQADEKDRNGNFKRAIKQYQMALNLDPYNIEILEKIVFAKSNNSKYSSAIDNLNTLIQLKPQSSKFHYLRGFFRFKLKNYEAALQDYSKAIEFQEDKISDFNIYSERGLCKMQLNDYEGAKEDYNKAFLIYPDPAITKKIIEVEMKLKENPPSPKFKVIETTNLHYIFLKKSVITSN